MSKISDMHLKILHGIQPHVRNIYIRANEIIPPSLIMSDRYFEVIKLLSLQDINNENKEIIRNTQRYLISKLLQDAIQNVPFYRKKMKINPDNINPDNAIQYLFEFPLISKQDIMNSPTEFVSKKFNRYFLMHVITSGSTGRGIALWKAINEFQIEHAFLNDMWMKFGYSKKAKILRLGVDAIVPEDNYPCQIKGCRLLVSPRHLNEKWLPQIIEKINAFNPIFIHAYPTCLEILAGYLKSKKMNLNIKGIFLASEEVRPEQLELFREIFNAPICFYYGSTEGVLLGYGCYDYDHGHICYHFNPLYGFVENTKDDYGYELVGTSLWNYAMPLIRYRTQDYGKIREDITECDICGKSWKTVQPLDGRKQYYLTTKQGTKFPGVSVRTDYFTWDHVSSLQFVQNKPGEIELHIIPRENFTDNVEKRILDSQKKKLSGWFDPIKIVKVKDIPLTKSGKRLFVVVNIDSDKLK